MSLAMITVKWCHWPGTSKLEQRNLSDVGKEVEVETSGSIISVTQMWKKTVSASLSVVLIVFLARLLDFRFSVCISGCLCFFLFISVGFCSLSLLPTCFFSTCLCSPSTLYKPYLFSLVSSQFGFTLDTNFGLLWFSFSAVFLFH